MKKITILALTIAMFATLSAQSVQETTLRYDVYTVTAYKLTVKRDVGVVSGALQQKLKDSGAKVSKANGYSAVLNQPFASVSDQPVDFYAKVERVGGKADSTVAVTFFAKSPNLTISQKELNVNVQRYAEDFASYIDRYDAQQRLGSEEKNLVKAQKTQEKAVAAAAAIDKSITSDHGKIEKKEAEIAKYQAKIEKLNSEIAKYQAKIDAINSDIEKIRTGIDKKMGRKSEADEKVNKANEAVQSSEDDVNRYRQQAGE